jgi:hydrophobe/amphiphile efflux-1 (HAE1) family protein
MSQQNNDNKSFGAFFVDRPIFAVSLSVAILIMGIVAMLRLPISLFPEVVPPTVTVTATYPGASAETIAKTVSTPIEQEVNGVDGMLYMYSQATNDGRMNLTVTFEIGTDIDMAQVLVQNRVALAEPRLPEEVRRTGISVRKNSPDFLMAVHMRSPDQSRDQLFLSNYTLQNIRDRLIRLPGVGSINMLGQRDYTMRIWLDPDRMSNLNLTAGEVVDAIREQNIQVAGGQLAQPPVDSDRAFQPIITLQGRLEEISQFENIIIKRGDDARIVKLNDVARIEIGAQEYTTNAFLNGDPIVVMLLTQQPGTNAIETSEKVKAMMADLSKDFPSGMEYIITYNPTDFFVVKAIDNLVHTIYEALILVVLVVLVFLQKPRATIIPIVAIPVSLVGTFLALTVLGYSINLLTLFGIVLAVGIVVDDAIIVVENVERRIHEGMSAKQASRVTMKEVSLALIATSLVLVSVFIPTMLIEGFSGQFYRQFGVAVAVATLISLFNSLTLTPALSGILLATNPDKKPTKQGILSRGINGFNSGFERMSESYAILANKLISLRPWVMLVYAGLIVAAFYVAAIIPKGFVPASDQGYLIVPVQLPPGSSLSRTTEVTLRVAEEAVKVPGIQYAHTFAGFDGPTGTNKSSSSTVFAQFYPYEERLKSGRDLNSIMTDLQARLNKIVDAQITVIPPPTVRGIGSSGGFSLRLQDYEDQGSEALNNANKALLKAINSSPDMLFGFSPYSAGAPEFFFDLDRDQAEMLNVPISNVFETLEVYLGSVYVNDFNLMGRTFQVRAQADSHYRLDPEQIANLKTRSADGQMVSLGTLGTIRPQTAPDRVPRYNLFNTAEIIGAAKPGISSADSLKLVQKIADDTLPSGFGIEWTDLSYQQQIAKGGVMLFVLGAIFAFLVLASQYESWSLPIAVMLIVPMTLLSALGGLMLVGMDANIFSQIGLVVLIGLAAKNAILIVEFSRQHELEGNTPVEAAVMAAKQRLRPILMTSFAFILGVVPLMTATGAGAELRNALGTSVFFGMLGVTIFSLIFTPVFYVVMRQLADKLSKNKQAETMPVSQE